MNHHQQLKHRLKLAFFMIAAFVMCCQCLKRHDSKGEINKCLVANPEFLPDRWERNLKPVLKGFMHAYQPCVIETDNKDYPYMMWFFGWIVELCNPGYPGCDAMFVARSKDLDNWEVYCKDGTWDADEQNHKWQPVIYGDPDTKNKYYDSYHNGDPSVVIKDGVYYMAYSATSDIFPQTEGYPFSIICCVMGATSKDGIHWTKTDKPLLMAAEDEIFPPNPNPDRIGDFHRPCLLWDKKQNKWNLYFDYIIGQVPDFVVGLSENKGDFMKDKFEFVNKLDEPLLRNWPNPEMVCFDSVCYSFSDGSGYNASAPSGKKPSEWQSRQIMVAKSNDGLKWEKLYTIPPDPGIDANQIPQTLVCKRDGKWWLYLFYATQVGWRDNGVDYELFNEGEEYNWYYDQIRYMRHEITNSNQN